MADEEPSCGTAGPARRVKAKGDPNLCSKCRSAKPTSVLRGERWCGPCLESAVRFRFSVCTSRLRPPPGSAALLAFSGGPASTALLSLAQHLAREEGRKPAKFARMAVCHVDEAAVLPLEEFGVLPDELRAAVEAAVATDERVSFVRVGLEEIFKEVDGVEAVAAGLEGLSVNGGNDADGKPPTGTLSPRERLVALFSRLDGRLSSKEDLLHHFRTALLARTARRLGCSHVFLGDSSGRIAVRALSLTIKGRGERMPLDVAAESRPFPGLTFLRPLRDVLPDEIAAFNRFRRLEPVAVPGVASAMPFKASIDRLTEHLVVGLQAEFPATTGAVYKTAYKVDTLTTRGKLVRYGPSGREQAVPVAGSFPACALCLGDVHPGDYGWRRDRTVESLDQIGTGPAADGEAHEGNGHQAGARGEPAHAPDDPGDLFRDLCYACQNIARDLAASAVPGRRDLRHSESAAAVAAMDLPPHSAAAIAANRAKMRAAVAEFLLEDDA